MSDNTEFDETIASLIAKGLIETYELDGEVFYRVTTACRDQNELCDE